MKKEGLSEAEPLIGSGSGTSIADYALNMSSSSNLDSYQQAADAMLRLGLDPHISSTKATCLSSICQGQQERTSERVKRLVKKTRKAVEAAETEHLFSPAKKSKKRKTLTLPLSVKPTRLILRIPLSQMATDGVEGKENIVPDNCKEESGMDMRNEAREREERGKVGEKMERSKLILRIPLLQKCGAEMSTDVVEAKRNNRHVNCNPESGIDMRNEAREREERGKVGEKMERSKLILRIPLLQKCGAEMSTDIVEAKQNNRQVNCNPEFTMAMRNEERERKERGKVAEVDITPNYRILPVEDLDPPSTYQTDLERSVLNDRVRLVHRDTNYHRALNDHENDLLENEDKRFELDMLLEICRSTIKQVEIWINDMNRGSVKPTESYLSVGNKRFIEKLYGDRGVEIVELLKEKPDSVLPVILPRLRQKFEEVNNCRSDFNHA